MVGGYKYYWLLLCILYSSFSWAQALGGNHLNELYLSYSTNFLPFSENENIRFSKTPSWPVNYRIPGLVNVPSGAIDFISSRGGLTLGHNKRIKKHRIGGLLYYEPQMMTHKWEVRTVDLNTGVVSEPIGFNTFSESTINNIGVALSYNYNWLSRGKLQFYSGMSSGIYLRNSKTTYFDVDYFQERFPEIIEDFLRYKDTEYYMFLHFNVLGISYGDKWTINLESGIGNRGYINIGLSRIIGGDKEMLKEE